MPVGNDSASAFAHLEQRVSYLLERLEASSRSPRRQSRTGRGRAAGHSAPSRNPACELCRAGRDSRDSAAGAAAGQSRPGRYRQARIVRHPLQPVGNRPPHPGFAGSRSQHARPCGRPAGDDRRRSARRCAPRRSQRRSRSAPPAVPQAIAAAAVAPSRRDAAATEAGIAKSGRGRGAFRRRPARIPRRAAGRCRRCDGAATRRSAKFWSRIPRHRAPRSTRTCRRIIRSNPGTRPSGRPLRRRSASPLRKTPSAKFAAGAPEPASTSSFIAAARRAAQAAAAAPPTTRPRAAAKAKQPRPPHPRPTAERKGALDDHLQDPLAAGRRQRGRDRARHLQDGDDAARQRQPAADRRRWKIRANRRTGCSRPRSRRQAGHAGARRSLR